MPSEYRFAVADTPELRRMPWEKMDAEGVTRTVLWNCARPTLYDWLELVSPSHTLMGVAFDDDRCGDVAGALWVIPSGRCGTVHFVMFRDWREDSVRLGREADFSDMAAGGSACGVPGPVPASVSVHGCAGF